MTKPIGAAAYAAIEAAMARLLARIDGPATLTMARLASEAGVSRATLYRAPELLDRFRAALERRNGDNTTALASPDNDHIGELVAEIATLRDRESDEMRDLRAANRNMAQHIQALSLLVREQEQQIAKLQLELSESARVVPLVGLARR
jgi:AcrR family transcriptional regulator